IYPLQDWEDPAKKIASNIKALASNRRMADAEKAQLLNAAETALNEAEKNRFLSEADAVQAVDIDYDESLKPLLQLGASYPSLIEEYLNNVQTAFSKIPTIYSDSKAEAFYKKAQTLFALHQQNARDSEKQ